MSDEQLAAEIDEAIADSLIVDAEITVRNLSKREVDVRLAPFGVAIETIGGPEIIERGAFRGVDPAEVLLMGLDHEMHLGIGQDGKPKIVRRPMGRGIAIEEREDGAYGTFRVAKINSGDEFLALAEDGVYRGVSVEMGRNRVIRTEQRDGRRTSVVTFADLRALSPTYLPAYADAQVLAVRALKEDATVAVDPKATDDVASPEPEAASQPAPKVETPAYRSADEHELIGQLAQRFDTSFDRVLGRLEAIEERGRMSFDLPGTPKDAKVSAGVWMETALKIITGERIPDAQYRVVQDFITTDNAGVVPDAFSSEIIGVIDAQRPFLASTRRLETPDSGMTLVVPKITQRPTVAKQSAEKASSPDSTKSIISSENFDVQTYGGVGDISIQLLKRSSPSFLALYLELLAEAYAIETDDAAVAALIAAINDGGPEPATALNPASLNLGNSFIAAFNATRRPPDTLWLSTKAVGEFIDAKATTTNQPLYPGLVPSATAGGGISGSISGLRAVHVPALDDKGAYAIVGPSRGFAWAEDGTYTLQVDVPSKAGRDVALVGMVWFAPYYPTAFSLFNVASQAIEQLSMSSGGEGESPTVDELKKSIDQPTDNFDPQLDRHLDAAIEQVKLDVADWDEDADEPDASLAQAALLLAIRIAGAPSQAPRVLARDADYERLIKGHRRRFSIA